MTVATLGSLIDLIRDNRIAREENVRAMDESSLEERVRRRVQIAAFDQDFRQQLAEIDELPSLLQFAMRIQEGWPYPSDEALELFRAQVAHLARRSMTEVDAMPLQDVLVLFEGSESPSPQPESAKLLEMEGVEDINVSKLPRWARVAYVARCARRAHRLLLAVSPNPDAEWLHWFDAAIASAERSAGDGSPDSDGRAAAEVARRGEKAGMAQVVPPSGRPMEVPIYDRLLYAAGNAAVEAAKAGLEADSGSASESFKQARAAAITIGSSITLESMARDWNYFRAMSNKNGWTDDTPVPPAIVPSPSLKLTGLYIKGLRAIHKFELPKDGLGWGGHVPQLIVIGGVNGSGKTTLLEFVAAALKLITKSLSDNYYRAMPKVVDAAEAWLDFEVEAFEIPKTRMRFIVGDEDFVRKNRGDNSWGFRRTRDGGGFFDLNGNGMIKVRQTIADWFAKTTIPAALYFSSEERTLVVPHEGYKAAGKLTTAREFVHSWRRPTHWKDSLEAILYSLRWEDLNAREERRYTYFSGFEAYAEAFRRFTGDKKGLSWEQAELVVRLANSPVRHDLAELSSGEKQVLLLSGEILRHWKPGSLVMIDEPELHLHSTWQTRLYETLRFWQSERGGQVIMATQSSHLFRTVEPGSVALLGVDEP